MNRERAKELLPIIQAYANGETIQSKFADHDWRTVDLALHMPDEYRIKPKPREWWLDPSDGELLQQDRKPGGGFIKVREVLS